MVQQRPSATQVRTLVERVVGEVLGAEGASPAPSNAVTQPTGTISDVALGADHGGFALKQRLAADLRDRGLHIHDCGTTSPDPVDYPDIADAVAQLVASGQCQAGIVIDGAGIGSAIAANKVPGVRAATCWDISSAENSRMHNHANVLALGAGLLGEALALQVVAAWLATAWGGDRHARRVGKIDQIEQRYTGGRT